MSELGLDQKDLAAAAHVTESYISQLLSRKKAPPAPGRTDIYEKIAEFLGLPRGELSKLAEVQRQHELRKRVAEPQQPLFQDRRELILRKCAPDSRAEVRRIFENEPFGELERLVTQKILEVAQGAAREEHISIEGGVSFLDLTIDSWDIDLRTFSMEVVLDRQLAPRGIKRFEFVEKPDEQLLAVEPGFEQFLEDKSLSGDATDEEIAFLQMLKFKGRRPSPLYYYRELQNLRDPLHFPDSAQPAESNQSTAYWVPRRA